MWAYAGRFFAVYNGEDYLAKYWTLRRKALIFDVPEKPIEISGPDAIPFLDMVLTRKVTTMKEGRGYLNQKIMWLKKYFYRNGIEATKKAI